MTLSLVGKLKFRCCSVHLLQRSLGLHTTYALSFYRSKTVLSVKIDLDLTKMIWTRPKWFGQFWTGPNCSFRPEWSCSKHKFEQYHFPIAAQKAKLSLIWALFEQDFLVVAQKAKLTLIELLCHDCFGTFTFGIRSFFASLILILTKAYEIKWKTWHMFITLLYLSII